MSNCLTCDGGRTEIVLDLGMQAISSHYIAARTEANALHPISLAVCRSCGLVQLAQPFPSDALISPHDWISYREPETHLDDVTAKLLQFEGTTPAGLIVGMSFKDITILDRFRARGFERVQSLNARKDLGATKDDIGVASLQALFTPEKAASFVERNGRANLVIARHVLEHAERPAQFLDALIGTLAPGGYLVIEVPDCSANLSRRDYTMIWEEHALYFTPATLRQTLTAAGMEVVSCEIHPFRFEDVIVVCARKLAGADTHPRSNPTTSFDEVALAKGYGQDFVGWTKRYHDLFAKMTANGKRLVAYGAGHLTVAFLNFHAVAGYFDCVVDDTPQKQGLYMPLSGLPIVAPDRLAQGGIEHAFFGLAPQIEDKVIAKNGAFTALGGQFHSILVDSPRSVRNLMV